MEFISCNLVTLIEAKQLETLNLERLRDLSKFYRSYNPLVESRIITPYSYGLNVDDIDLISLELLYDTKYIDGLNLNNNEDEAIRKTRVNSQCIDTSLTSNEEKEF
jgi:hypothetical protein